MKKLIDGNGNLKEMNQMIKDENNDPGNRKGYRYPSHGLNEEDRCPFKEGSKFWIEWMEEKRGIKNESKNI